MDAYVFATSATNTAVSSLISAVGTNGIRVVCPLTGGRGLYVAVTAADEPTLEDRVDAVAATSGLSGTSTHFVISNYELQASFPTHAEVSTYIGMALLDPTGSATGVADAADALPGVVGIAIVSGNDVLVEVTGTTSGGVTSLLSAVTAISGTSTTFTATGLVSAGAGF